MQLIKDGLLMIPLFHGTSTLFLDEILSKGLGGVNPIIKYNIMATLEKLVQKGYEYLPKSEQRYLAISNMKLKQTVGNFRYNGVYLSPSKITAVKYSRNRYGSELITHTVDLYLFLKECSVPVEMDNDFLNHIINSSYQPVVIMASGIPRSLLKSENNNISIDVNFKKLQSLLDEPTKDFQYFSQQTNFELLSPKIITSEHLTVLSGEEYNNIREKYKSAFLR
ncbi:hypothetical protein [Alkalihalobacillus deserti]|uniref:hypothetical protein n=1 Tax=Alkalihalobacillus deserti TaxID=2879466 RepID=UPI001D151170|nr:hypothetical protein [Alkalihalobacillus deserti]